MHIVKYNQINKYGGEKLASLYEENYECSGTRYICMCICKQNIDYI